MNKVSDSDELVKRITDLERENSELKKWQNGINQLMNQMLDIVSFQDKKLILKIIIIREKP